MTPPPLLHFQVRVDHRNGTLHFGAQQLESDKIRNHISLLARRLSKAVTMIEPGAVPAAVAAQKDAALALCREHVEKEHSRLLARKQVSRVAVLGPKLCCYVVQAGCLVCLLIERLGVDIGRGV